MPSAPLASWRDTSTRSSIVEFVARVATAGSPAFVAPAGRIAVFDNDGTLWCEKPMPIQVGFLLGKIAEQVASDPSLRAKQPWKAVAEKDHAWLGNVITKHYQGDDSDLQVMAEGLLAAYAGESAESFAAKAEAYLRGQRNELLKRPYLGTAYAPMRELLDYLTANGFSNYIVSGGGRDFMRPVTQELYGIPPERVVGSAVALEYREDSGVGNVYHTAKLDVFDDGPAKVVRIWNRIGARPLFAAGNSNGDIEMLKFASASRPAGFALLLDHDDDEREVAYQGGAEKALAVAKASGWTVASLARDWTRVFAD